MTRKNNLFITVARAISVVVVICFAMSFTDSNKASRSMETQNERLLQVNNLLLSSQIKNRGDNGNVVFQIYDRDKDEDFLWAYDASDNEVFQLPYAIPMEFSISKSGRFASYWDARHGFDAIIVYDIDGDSIVKRISVADNYSRFKYVNDQLLYSIDAGLYIYDTDRDSTEFVLQNIHEDAPDYSFPINFAISNDGKYAVIAYLPESAETGKPVVNVYRMADGNNTFLGSIAIPTGEIQDFKFNSGSDALCITYSDNPSVAIVYPRRMKADTLQVDEPYGNIFWVNDTTARIDCPVRSYRIHPESGK